MEISSLPATRHSGGWSGIPASTVSAGRHSSTAGGDAHGALTARTGAAYWGSVIERRASEWPRMYSISSGVDAGLVGTMTAPILAAAIQKRRNSGQFQLAVSPPASSKRRKGRSGNLRALSSRALFNVRVPTMSTLCTSLLLARDEVGDTGARRLVPERRRVGLGFGAGAAGADLRHDGLGGRQSCSRMERDLGGESGRRLLERAVRDHACHQPHA